MLNWFYWGRPLSSEHMAEIYIIVDYHLSFKYVHVFWEEINEWLSHPPKNIEYQ